MKKLHIIWIALMMFSTAGCLTTKDERANLKASQAVYTSVSKQILVANAADLFSDKDKEHIKLVSSAISLNLTLWNKAIQNGLKRPDLAYTIDANIQELTKHLIRTRTE